MVAFNLLTVSSLLLAASFTTATSTETSSTQPVSSASTVASSATSIANKPTQTPQPDTKAPAADIPNHQKPLNAAFPKKLAPDAHLDYIKSIISALPATKPPVKAAPEQAIARFIQLIRAISKPQPIGYDSEGKTARKIRVDNLPAPYPPWNHPSNPCSFRFANCIRYANPQNGKRSSIHHSSPSHPRIKLSDIFRNHPGIDVMPPTLSERIRGNIYRQ